MKKRAAPKKVTARKTVKRTIPRSSSRNQTIFFRRIVIISACLLLVIVGGVLPNKRAVNQAVAGASIVRVFYNQASISLPAYCAGACTRATSYNLYFKQAGEKTFTNAARNIQPTNVNTTVTIQFLKQGVTYLYEVKAVKEGKEFYTSPIKPIVNSHSMN